MFLHDVERELGSCPFISVHFYDDSFPIVGFRSLIKMLALNQLVSKVSSSIFGVVLHIVHL